MYMTSLIPKLMPHQLNAHDYFDIGVLCHAGNLYIVHAIGQKIHNGQNEIWCGNLYPEINSSIECLKIL